MNTNLKMAIDLLWVKHNQIGGVESYIRNILDGFVELKDPFTIILLVAKDNADSFSVYGSDKRFKIIVCGVNSMEVPKRIAWQNLNLGKMLKKLGVKLCFEPHNYIPTLGVKNISFVTTIHDLQLAHYPEYFSKMKVLWFRYNWKNTLKKTRFVVAISNAVKKDINDYYPGHNDKIVVIYNPIIINKDECADINEIHERYGVKTHQFYYTVSSLHPHKNLQTLINVFEKIKKEKKDLPCKLLISGIGGTIKDQFLNELNTRGMMDNVVLTGFVDNRIRNALYKYSKAFLFPSVFEGFGMPPIEALLFGTPVLTTKESCLEEVTQGKANYVNNPYDVDEWIQKMQKCNYTTIDFKVYEKNNIAEQYYNLFRLASK